MDVPDSTTQPVVVKEVPRRHWPNWGFQGVLVLGAAVVPLTLLWHPVPWWGWIGSAILLGVSGWVPRGTSPTGCRLVGDAIELTRDGERWLVPARQVAGIVTGANEQFPVLRLIDGRSVALDVPHLWRDTAYPTIRVLADWVVAHGGGASDALRPLPEVPAPKPSLWQRLVANRKRLAAMLVLWVGMVLVLSAAKGLARPDFSRGWGAMLGVALGGAILAPAQEKDWTKTRTGW